MSTDVYNASRFDDAVAGDDTARSAARQDRGQHHEPSDPVHISVVMAEVVRIAMASCERADQRRRHVRELDD
jgi:hypothetical protein